MTAAGAPAVRRGEARDVPALTALYNRFVETTIVNFDVAPFSLEARGAWFAQFADRGRHQIFVAEIDGAFAGYAASMRHKEKRAYETTVETTIYVDPCCHRRGAARALYAALFAALEVEDVRSAVAGVALPNDASIALHRAFGFTPVGVFHDVGRKFGRYHDVLWMERLAPGAAAS
jgi:phosphinothricin acetyltransferase